MISGFRTILFRLLAVLLCAAAQAQDAPAADPLLPGLVQQPIDLRVTLPDGSTPVLEALVLRPDRPGRWPLVLMTPGTPRQALAGLAEVTPQQLLTAAVEFARRGYAAVVVLRRGYGRSQGPYAEGPHPCRDEDYVGAGEAAADDLTGALAVLRAEPWADGRRVLLLGKSTGGFSVLAAAARHPDGVVGVLDFAGGRGSPRPDVVCQPDRLLAALARYGAAATIPSQWLWTGNDHYFSPDLARRMLAAYTAQGASARLTVLPPFSRDGHRFLYNGPAGLWWPAVEGFLASLGLPTRPVVDLPPVPELPPPDGADAGCRARFADYAQSRNAGKAMVVAAGGHCAFDLFQRTGQDAADRALATCRARWPDCRVYAEGQRLVR